MQIRGNFASGLHISTEPVGNDEVVVHPSPLGVQELEVQVGGVGAQGREAVVHGAEDGPVRLHLRGQEAKRERGGGGRHCT
jgi:hypothetical protein